MNAKKLFVIACYYDGSNNSVFECVKSIQKCYKSPQIVVIDSASGSGAVIVTKGESAWQLFETVVNI